MWVRLGGEVLHFKGGPPRSPRGPCSRPCQTFAKRLALHPDYDEPFLEWLFGELVLVEWRGRLVAQLVEAPSGRPLGWYLYYLRPGGRSEVLQVAGDEGDVGRVLDHLLDHAYTHGSGSIRRISHLRAIASLTTTSSGRPRKQVSRFRRRWLSRAPTRADQRGLAASRLRARTP
jgi:hypothetical protein